MKFNVMWYFLIFFIMVILLSPTTFASWTSDNPPKRPSDDTPRTCAGWIEYHNFSLRDYETNRRSSVKRNITLDHEASTWAAIYAFVIGGMSKPSELLPEEFCRSRGAQDKTFPFTTLDDEKFNCPDWIYLYGFTADDVQKNVKLAKNQHFVKNEFISLWADNYSKYIAVWSRYALTPSEFCTAVGKSVSPDAALMPFIVRRTTKKTCEDWIKLFDYTDDVEANFTKAATDYERRLHILISRWARRYAAFLRESNLEDVRTYNETPKKFCSYCGVDDECDYFTPEYNGVRPVRRL